MNDGGKYIFTFLDKDEDGLFKDMAEHADVVEFWPSHREDTRFNKPFKKLLMNHRIAKGGGVDVLQHTQISIPQRCYL